MTTRLARGVEHTGGSGRSAGADMGTGPRRCRGDRGAGMVTGLVLLFALTAGGVIWLARDVDRAVANRGAAQSIAFQSARAGAQRVDLTELRDDGAVAIDPDPARAAALEAAGRLLGAYDLSGSVTRIDVEGDRVTVVVEVVDGGRTVTGIGTARARDGSGGDGSGGP